MLGLGNLLTKSGVIKKFPNDFSFNFDGSNDYLDTGESFESTLKNSFTLSAWIKPSDGQPSAKGSICGTLKYDNFSGYVQFSQETNGKLRLTIGTPSAEEMIGTSSVVFSDGASDWTHVVAVFTKSSATTGTIALYANGADVSDTTTKDGSWNIESYVNTYNMFIGARNQTGTPNQFLNGLIDEVGIWDTALSASDVAKLGSKPVNLSKASTYATDRTSNLKLWLRAGDKVLPESDTSIARSDFYTDFDGTNDLIKVNADSSINNLFATGGTFTAWVNVGSIGETAGRVAEKGFTIYTDTASGSTCKLNIYVPFSTTAGNWLTTNHDINFGEWQHIAITYDGSSTSNNASIYINGISVAVTENSTPNGTISADTATLYIGNNSATDRSYNGSMSSFTLHQTALDAQTISQMAKSRFTPMRDNRFSVVDFDGSDDYIDCGNDSSLQITGALTISAWARKTGTSTQRFITKYDGTNKCFYLAIQSNGKFRFNITSSNSETEIDGTSNLNDSSWHHLTAVYTPSTSLKVYVDGALEATNTSSIPASLDNDSVNFVIGAEGDAELPFQGQISSASVYNTAKSAEEIYAQYSKGITHNPSADTGLVGLWRMGSDTSKAYPTIADSSSNSNDGTITNGASDDIVQQMVAGYDMGAFESSSEELDASLASSLTWTNYSFETLTSDGNSIIEADNTSGHGICHTSVFSVTAGKSYKITFNFTLNSGSFSGGVVRVGTVTAMSSSNHTLVTSPSNGLQTYYFTPSSSSSSFLFGFRLDSGSFNFSVSDLSIQEVLQSELSDTYPAIIDVNEPVLGVELFTSISAGTNWSYDSSAETLTASGATTTSYTNVLSGVSEGDLVKLTFDVTGYTGGSVYISCGGGDQNTSNFINGSYELYLFSGSGTQKIAFDGGTAYTAVISNISVKEVSGNVGKMTNQAISDLAYSSVLPDQSFLTGVNSAYNFIDLDGGDQYIDAGALDSALVPPLSISMWVKGNSQSGATLIQDDAIGSGLLYTRAGNEISLYTTAGEKSYSYTLDNTWVNIVLTQASSAKPLVYVNGSLLSDGSQDNTPNPSFSNIRIGGDSTEFNGSIGQSAIWNKVLSSTEVGAIYTLGRHGNLLDSYSDNLKGYWGMSSLDASTGLSDSISTIYDRSGNSNHGTPQNADAGDLASSPNAEPNGYAKGDTNRSTTIP